MDIQTLEIVKKANQLVKGIGTRNPHKMAEELGIDIIPLEFKKQRGAYKVIMRNRFIFLKCDLLNIKPLFNVFEDFIIRQGDLGSKDICLIFHSALSHIKNIKLFEAACSDRFISM